MKIFFLLAFSILLNYSYAQKLPVNPSIYESWTSVVRSSISDNGKYVSYSIINQPIIDYTTTVIQSTDNNWKKELLNVNEVFFTSDNKYAIFLKQDTLYKMKLGTNIVDVINKNITSYKITGNRDWIGCQLNDKNNELIIKNLLTEQERRFQFVKDFKFNDEGTVLLVETEKKDIDLNSHAIQFVSLFDGKVSTIWSESSKLNKLILNTCIFDTEGKKIAFTVKQKTDDSLSTTIWYYDSTMDEAKLWVSNELLRLHHGFTIAEEQSGMSFNMEGDKLFFGILKKVIPLMKNEELAAVDVWNYKEYPLQTAQNNTVKQLFNAVISNDRIVTPLENEYDDGIDFSCSHSRPLGNYVISVQSKYSGEYWWNKGFQNNIYLISTRDASRKSILEKNNHFFSNLQLSPKEQFVTWYDKIDNQYYGYEISTGITRNLSIGIPYALYDDEKSSPNKRSEFGVVGWVENDTSILVYDRFDIWEIDPKGRKPSINLTNSYGRRNNIVLSIADEVRNRVLSTGDHILLAGFNRTNKHNGFFKITLGKIVDPEKGNMEPFTYCIPRTVPYTKGLGNINEDISGGYPVKAKNANAYITSRMSAEESPNYYFTNDFRTFKKLSHVYPERKYNWLTSELISWEMNNGRKSQGILYKPENFDPKKKYPVIFYYYEEKSDGLHMYMRPNLSSSIINIPYYVSNEYLVFVPDVYFEKGKVGEGTVNSVVSAAKYLMKFSWVDSTKLGIQGQSFGGYETNYLVTHSSIFAAACEGSGASDLISSYGQLTDGIMKGNNGSYSRQSIYEIDQSYIGATPWESPDLYISNSPIFSVQKATTPLLIWHCKDDRAVPFEQAVEMFVNMKRAGKKIWMLQYDGDGHGTSGKNAIDLDIRMTQFFNHYLKSTIAPVWMTEGVPAKYKQIKTGLELDESGGNP